MNQLSFPGSRLLLGYPSADQLYLSSTDGAIKIVAPSVPKAGHHIFPSLSRDGDFLATAYGKAPYPNYREGIAVYSVRDKTWRNVGDLYIVWALALSPDASRIAVIADRSSSSGAKLLLVDLKTASVEVLSDNISDQAPVTWSPEGKYLAYGNILPAKDPSRDIHESEINVLEIATKHTRKLAKGAWPSWSPSGEWIALINSDGNCAITRPDGSEYRVLTTLSRHHGFEFPPVWSPASDKLLLNEAVDDERGRLIIHLFDLSTHKLQKVTGEGVGALGWSLER